MQALMREIKTPTAGTQVNPGHAQATERADYVSGGDQYQETGGEKAESLQQRRGVGGGP